MSQAHLSEDQLVEDCLGLTSVTDIAAHLRLCAPCTARRQELERVLAESSASATQAADAAFSNDWLARQRARILQRVAIDGRPAKVLAFPGHPPSGSQAFLRPSASRRWLAAGVAAGLAIGLLTGHLVSRTGPASRPVSSGLLISQSAVEPLVRSIAASDDEFLGQLELAGASGGPESLRPLDALTPRAWDIR